MDFWKTLLVLVRRWYVAVPVFVVALGAAGFVFATTPAYYDSTGLLLLTTPPGGSVVESDPLQKRTLNPLLGFDDGLKISATMLIQNLNSPAVMQELTTAGSGDSYSVSNGQVDGPFIAVKADSKSPDNARKMVEKVLARARQELDTRQTTLQAPKQTFITVSEVITPTQPVKQVSGKMRGAGAALVLGIAACLTVAYGLESYSVRRRRRTEGGDDAETGAGAEDSATADPLALLELEEPGGSLARQRNSSSLHRASS
ncbi:hypothetical protein F0L68_18290 [Solihabitans fulvus]|uniref:Capsular polysaccharide biosynthesis protein n=1 Tax=Solihabitans fulvus TaxID=1892852 RepID=A0A5B2XC66_9PSEU|nr:hypothetical protein [Solihabitans fulvus]KAA2261177.1 hypothetical protein F0L68_18290 [Solihabitans fulvus]